MNRGGACEHRKCKKIIGDSTNMTAVEALAFTEAIEQLTEAKRLLKLSLEQTNPKCKYCIHDLEEEQPNYNPCCTGETANCKWVHADEAEKLLNKIRVRTEYYK